MDYMKLKLSIYESYGNGEMTSEACSHLIDSLDMKYGESIAEEAANAENDFINASLKVFTESAGEDALTEAAKDFGAKIKAAWEKFKAWIKKIIEKILNLGKKPEQQKAKIQVPKALDKALSDAKKWIAKLGGAKTAGAMAAAVAGIMSSTALIIKNRKLKETVGAKTYEYEKFKKEQADLVKQMQDAALKAQQEINNLTNDNKDIHNKYSADTEKLKKEKDEVSKELDRVTKQRDSLANQARQLIKDYDSLYRKDSEKIYSLTSKNEDQSKEIDKLNDKIFFLKNDLKETEEKLDKAYKELDAKSSSSTSDEKVTDSKILSASTGLVNAVTQTVVALLPQYSTKTTDDIDGKVSTYVSKYGYIHFREGNNPDMRILMDAKSSGRKSRDYIKNFIKTKLMADNSVISDYLKKIDDVDREISNSTDTVESTFRNKLESAYNFDTIDGMRAFANDYASGSGEVGSMIKNAINEAKKVSSIGTKYKSMGNHIEYSKDKADAAVKDYRDIYQAYQITRMTYDIIRDMSIDLKKHLHNVK